MIAPLCIKNAKLILADEILPGALATNNGMIASIDHTADLTEAEDFEGDYLVPGLVELHTDHLETHYNPRPRVYWNPIAALQAHDAQIAASGITTVFDAVRLGSDPEPTFNMGEHISILIDTITHARQDKRLRAEHFVHLRCELAAADTLAHFETYHDYEPVRLASLMDHTPGQRQFVTMELYNAYYQKKTGRTDAEMQVFIAERMADQQKYSDTNRRGIVALAQAAKIILASHDDALPEHIEEAQADNIRISEFPTTEAAAQGARDAGMAILMGAPNVVRGKSHSGNISANALARCGLLDILSSDYVPFSLLQAAFTMPLAVEEVSLSQAINMVSRNPAHAIGMDDRGEIAIGKRADFSRVELRDGVPLVKSVWRQGKRVI